MDIEINSSIKSAKSKLIVETATDLFMRYGVKRVTVEEICKTAKISKMTFYKYFKNKKELSEYIIFSILDNAQIEFDAIWNEVSTFNQKIDQFINLKMAYAKKFSNNYSYCSFSSSGIIRPGPLF
jgi:AcrR family transcriptional regulator